MNEAAIHVNSVLEVVDVDASEMQVTLGWVTLVPPEAIPLPRAQMFLCYALSLLALPKE